MIDQKTTVQLLSTIKKYSHINIFIKGSPDPDAMASSYVLKVMCESLGTKATIYSLEKITFHQNIQFKQKLKLPIYKNMPIKNHGNSNAYAVLDHQSSLLDGITGMIPCAIHIDHHDQIAEKNPVDVQLIDTNAGSTCTIITSLYRQLETVLNITPRLKRKLVTSLYFGIQTDTTNFEYASPIDKDAQIYLSPFVDFYVIETLSQMPFPKEMTKIINQATTDCIIQNDWAIVGLGFIDRKNRDVLPMIADDLLQKKNVIHVAVFSLISEKNHLVLEASFRTKEKNFNLNRMIKRITKSGGGRNYKGAFQITMDYFLFCEEKELLWKLVSQTTMCAIRQHGGMVHPGWIGKLSNTIKKNLLKLFEK